MSKWVKQGTATIIDTDVSGITEAGTYYLLRNGMERQRNFVFGAKTKVAGHTASVQLFADVLGVRTNLGDPLVPTFGFPAAGSDEYTLTGERGIVVSALTGAVYPEALQ